MLGSQFHPEFKSRPNRPHPLFLAFLRAAEVQRVQQATDHADVNAMLASIQQ
jgi:CTP synthase